MTGIIASLVGIKPAAGRTAKTVTAIGAAQVSTTQNKFGGASYKGDGSTARLETSASADFNITTETFTVECFFYLATAQSGNYNLFGTTEEFTRGGFWFATWSTRSFLWGSKNSADTAIAYLQSSTAAWSYDAWNHVAVTRNGGTLNIYSNGSRVYTTSTLSNIKAWTTGLGKVYVGWGRGQSGSNYSDGNQYWNPGYIDEIRFSNNERYTGTTYTVPTAAFTNDSNTLLLIHANGANASTTFTDDNA